MSSVTVLAWQFDPAFQLEGPPPGDWQFEPTGSNSAQGWGSAIDMTSRIREVTFNDQNGDGMLSGGSGDTFTVNGSVYQVDYVYNGDAVYVNNTWYETVTFYGSTAGGDQRAITLPVVDGSLAPAFSGSVSSTWYILTPNQFSLPLEEIPCFVRGTQILTDRGTVAIENLSVGDLVLTRDREYQPIRWIGSRKLSSATLDAKPNLRPIRIRAGALGHNTPTTDLLVSPQHRILARSVIALRMFGANEVLAAVKQFLQLDGFDIAEDLEEVEYFHFLCDQHEVVYSNGAETESLYTGAMALKSVGPAAREEIFTLFPELRDRDPEDVPPSVRELLTGRMARKLAVRHVLNQKPLVSAQN